jgi:ABC-type polysaccharide/polyol phosphate export permease
MRSCDVPSLPAGTRSWPRWRRSSAGWRPIAAPATFFGAVYYPWPKLGAVLLLKTLDLANPLVHINEVLRAVPTASVQHMAPYASCQVMAAFTIVLATVGIRRLSRRAIS